MKNLSLEKTKMPLLDSGKRQNTFCEVTLGYNLEDRIKHHEEARSEKTITLEKINPDWVWEYDEVQK